MLVLPLTREWIEITHTPSLTIELKRSPSYEGVDWNILLIFAIKFGKVLPLTREWIEILWFLQVSDLALLFSLLRGSGLKYQAQALSDVPYRFSLLRGSGLKWILRWMERELLMVLPLTREWIEIASAYIWRLWVLCSPSYEGVDWNSAWFAYCMAWSVLPLTREWIEINLFGYVNNQLSGFSLLRGSGLKFLRRFMMKKKSRFSLLRGSGLKFVILLYSFISCLFSLLRGSGLKFLGQDVGEVRAKFSLLRGSGLKSYFHHTQAKAYSSPSYEGVDWNPFTIYIISHYTRFSLLRGSGLKFVCLCLRVMKIWFSLLRGSGLKYCLNNHKQQGNQVLPLTREWIEIFQYLLNERDRLVLPLTREWIEIKGIYPNSIG